MYLFSNPVTRLAVYYDTMGSHEVNQLLTWDMRHYPFWEERMLALLLGHSTYLKPLWLRQLVEHRKAAIVNWHQHLLNTDATRLNRMVFNSFPAFNPQPYQEKMLNMMNQEKTRGIWPM